MMRKLFWMLLLVGGYFWVIGSGREAFFLDRGKEIYRLCVRWFDDAEIDYQITPSQYKKPKKKMRRWD